MVGIVHRDQRLVRDLEGLRRLVLAYQPIARPLGVSMLTLNFPLKGFLRADRSSLSSPSRLAPSL